MKKHPRVILGIADNHDAGAAIVVDGKVVAAVSEERLDRVKGSGAFPHRSIEAVLQLSGISPRELERVAVGTSYTPSAALRALRGLHHRLKAGTSQFSYLLHLYILYQVTLRHLGLEAAERLLSRPLLKAALRDTRVIAPLGFVDHHTAHASSAALTAPREGTLVITLDAMGDGTSVTVSVEERGRIRTLFRQSGMAGINTYYSRITEYLGFRPLRHEGKVTGLAAFVPAPQKLLEHCATLLCFQGPGFKSGGYWVPTRPGSPAYQELGRFTREEIAAAVQRNLETQVCAFVSYWVHKTGIHDLSVAGGVFANVKLNQRLLELPGVHSLWVYPHMSDGGLPVGAALLLSGASPYPMESPYLGPDISEEAARQALEAKGLAYERPAEMSSRLAALLSQGKVVARAAGRLEWGPRALGNRSILYRPDDRSVNDWLNKRLRRTEFMPFAPSTLEEEAAKCYEGLKGGEISARYMTICFDCTPHMKERGAGVVHVDGTARPQIVRQADNPDYHAILTHYARLTGIGTVVNTSFNLHEEPIVATAEDAVRGFLDAELDALAVGPYLTLREGRH